MQKAQMFNLDDIVSKLENKTSKLENKIGGTTNKINTDMSDKYVEIIKSNWGNIELNTYIRYKGTDGKLKQGGRVKAINKIADNYVIGIEKKSMKSRPYFWNVSTNNITNIYKLKDEYMYKKSNAMSNTPNAMSNTPNAMSNATNTMYNAPIAQDITGGNNTPDTYIQGNGINNILGGTNEDDILSKLGGKLMFDDADTINKKITSMEIRMDKVERDIKKILNILDHLNNKISR
jgi:hypothetical protein